MKWEMMEGVWEGVKMGGMEVRFQHGEGLGWEGDFSNNKGLEKCVRALNKWTDPTPYHRKKKKKKDRKLSKEQNFSTYPKTKIIPSL